MRDDDPEVDDESEVSAKVVCAGPAAKPRPPRSEISPSLTASQALDEPEICFHDAVLWVASLGRAADGPFTPEEYDAAERRLVNACVAGLALKGFHGEWRPRADLETIPASDLRALTFGIGGQPSWDGNRHDGRPYGIAHYEDAPSAAPWTGLVLNKADVLAAFQPPAPADPSPRPEAPALGFGHDDDAVASHVRPKLHLPESGMQAARRALSDRVEVPPETRRRGATSYADKTSR
jgi:hypothetical protein